MALIGTTALGEFLKLHPGVRSNDAVPGSFEEPQFFGAANYAKGLEWYRKLFPTAGRASVVLEKTANYFDNDAAPASVASLVPDAKLLVILMDPVDRAFSWFQVVFNFKDATFQ